MVCRKKKRKTKKNLKEAEKIKRVKGHQRIAWFADYVSELNAGIDIAMQNTDNSKIEQVMRDMGSCTNKTSAIELKQQIEMYKKGIQKKRQAIKADNNPNGIHHSRDGRQDRSRNIAQRKGTRRPRPCRD